MPFVTRIGLFALATLTIALAVRFVFVEPPELAWVCQADGTVPWWCPWREGAIAALRLGVFGLLSVTAGILAILGGGRRIAGVAIISGAAGLVLYGAGPAALGVVLGALRAIRL